MDEVSSGRDFVFLRLYKSVSKLLLAATWIDPRRSALQSGEQWCRDVIVKSTKLVKCQFLTIVQKHANTSKKKAVGNNTAKKSQETIHVLETKTRQ